MGTEQSEMFSQMALALHREKVPAATVGLIVGYARSAVRCDEVGVAVTRRRSVRTAASTSSVVQTADQFQQSLGEGPGVAAAARSAYSLVDDTLADDRWPRWCEHIAVLGLRSVMSIQLHTDERTFGALNLYSRTPGSFTSSDVAVATTFARHASIAMASTDEVFNLTIAIDSRKIIGQAQGILMERFGIEGDRAFDVLRRYSQTSNIKLSTVAQQVVDERQLPVPGSAPAVRSVTDRRPPERGRLALTTRTEPPCTVLTVDGEIDISTAPDLIEAALALVDAGEVRLVIEMQGTTFVDSSGLSAFVLLHKATSHQGGSLDLVGVVHRVNRSFVLSGLDRVIGLHTSVAEAMDARGVLLADGRLRADPQ